MKKNHAPEALPAAESAGRPMKRTDVTEMVVEARLKKGLSWAKIAKADRQIWETSTVGVRISPELPSDLRGMYRILP